MIDLDEYEEFCPDCGRDKSVILCKYLMDRLVSIAEQQELKSIENKESIILFNKPLFLPANFIWRGGETGFENIYGIYYRGNLDKEQKSLIQYIGYLSAVEECYFNGETPSGFSTDLNDNKIDVWEKDGICYDLFSYDLVEEFEKCRVKNNLKILGIYHLDDDKIDIDEILNGIGRSFLLSQEVYEDLMEGLDVKSDK